MSASEDMPDATDSQAVRALPTTRGYQQEMLEESLKKNIIIALDTGSGKTHIAVLRMKIEAEREAKKVSWFFAPTVALCEQQSTVISQAIPVSVGLISGALEPNQWKDPGLWRGVLERHRIMVTTPQVLLDALRHGYVHLGKDIGLLVFDEAHHAVDNHPYNSIMKEFYFKLPSRPMAVDNSFRPTVLGLTASPIYGGHVESAFRMIEGNLDSTIRAPRANLEELAKFVHRPIFKHVQYQAPSYDFMISPSRNVASLEAVIAGMNIENDPYVQSLREELVKLTPGPGRTRVDQKLSKAISKDNTYTHKGLKDFARAASEICTDVGVWAADWYVERVLEHAKASASPYQNIISAWQHKEKTYLLRMLASVQILPVSYQPADIVAGISDKTRVLIENLVKEKENTEHRDEDYSGLTFVTRRDTVLALVEVLSHHPQTKNIFRIGCLLGSSDSAYRRSFLDITRRILKQTQAEVLLDFRVGEKNLIISTSVAEEGIDIQACGSVIRWDIPQNMTSWAQSRGRARRQRSTFILMFDDQHFHDGLVLKWERLEKEMQASYNNARPQNRGKSSDDESMSILDDEYLEFGIEGTGALLTLDSAVSHLSHFCSVLPSAVHAMPLPIYELDPPDFPEGWHSMDSIPAPQPYPGPWGSMVTLPRQVPKHLRVFTTDCIHPTKRSAYRHVAFKAYKSLYQAGLLNEHLLPLTSVVEPELEEEVKALLQDVEKRTGTASVTSQFDPWAPVKGSDGWWRTEIGIDGLPPLYMFTRTRPCDFLPEDLLTLYHPHRHPLNVKICSSSAIKPSALMIKNARNYTRRLFWQIYGNRMQWDNSNFAYLFYPAHDPSDASQWATRRAWWDEHNHLDSQSDLENALQANAESFGERFSFPDNLTIIRARGAGSKLHRFIRWKFDELSTEEDQLIRERFNLSEEDTAEPPFLVVQHFPRRMNFLVPFVPQIGKYSMEKELLLRPKFSTVDLVSATETDYALLLPSVIKYLAVATTVSSLRATLLTPTLAKIPLDLLRTAITAPVAQDATDYQRLEILGDTVLKFIVGVQLLARYPLWHEGYLTKKKDHAVSNSRLAKEAHSKGLYRWIIRDRFLAQKWIPRYIMDPQNDNDIMDIESSNISVEAGETSNDSQQLSTKMLADVVESLIGASYLHGGFDLAVECVQLFGLGLIWEKLPVRVDSILSNVESTDDFPTQTTDVEAMLGYQFTRKLLLVEALTHASHQFDLRTISYERMEFLGDSVLDMIVTDYLYHAPGKNYSPGHIHLRKSAVVNTHFLAYICLSTHLAVDTSLPKPNGRGGITVEQSTQPVYLWQCLLHSSPRILDDLSDTSARYLKNRKELENSFKNESIFPWAALTRLQAPKFYSDMVESLLGAIYLDSNGDLGVVKNVLIKLGILPILERIVTEDVDILHPVSRMSMWASRQPKEIEYKFEREKEKEKETITCIIVLDGKEEFRVTTEYRGLASQNDAKFAAAEYAVKMLHLREQDERVAGESED